MQSKDRQKRQQNDCKPSKALPPKRENSILICIRRDLLVELGMFSHSIKDTKKKSYGT